MVYGNVGAKLDDHALLQRLVTNQLNYHSLSWMRNSSLLIWWDTTSPLFLFRFRYLFPNRSYFAERLVVIMLVAVQGMIHKDDTQVLTTMVTRQDSQPGTDVRN